MGRRDPRRTRRRLWSPPAHWRLLAFCLAIVGVLIVFQGVATHAIGGSSESAPAGAAAHLPLGRSLLAANGDRLVAREEPLGRRVALTFDDGPDPRWTPRIAAMLRRERIPATFFVIGSEAARHPAIVRELALDGFEIGNHTFTHSALATGAGWQDDRQLELTQAVIVGLTGRYARLLRPPYSATPDAVTIGQERRLAQLIGGHHLVALADLDSRDWERPAVPAIVRNATPPGYLASAPTPWLRPRAPPTAAEPSCFSGASGWPSRWWSCSRRPSCSSACSSRRVCSCS